MSKFCILSALKSEIISGGRRASQCMSKVVLVFNADELRNTSINGCGLIFRCKRFSVDEKNCIGNWKDAFEHNLEHNDIVVITINQDYKRPATIMPFE
jgi:hypothetical protein